MFVPFLDPLYVILIMPAVGLGIVAMFLLRIWTDENRRRIASSNMSGAEVAQKNCTGRRVFNPDGNYTS